MTNANTTSLRDVSTNKQHRQLKVKRGWYDYQARQWINNRSTIAEIQLKGKWLADAGFAIDSKVDITIENGRLVITAV